MSIEFKTHSRIGRGLNPMLPVYRAELGKDPDGKNWLCEIEPVISKKEISHWRIWFDTDEEANDFPFLRHSVLYAENYWAAANKVYDQRQVQYCDIYKTVKSFIESHNIDRS